MKSHLSFCLFLLITVLATAQDYKPYTYSIYNFEYDPALNVIENKEDEYLELVDTLVIESVKWVWTVRLNKGEEAKDRTIDHILKEEEEYLRGIPKSFECWDIIRKVPFNNKEAVENTFYCKETTFGKRTSWTFIQNKNIATISVSASPEKAGEYDRIFEDLLSEDYIFNKMQDFQIK